MSNSPGVIIPWNGGLITFDSAESRLDVDSVMELLDGHVVTWLIDRPCANVIELLGPAAVNLSDGSRMLFMILRTPAHVKMPRWILWIGRPGEADGFIRNARKRSVVDGYRLMQRPYEFTANPEDN